MKIYINGIQASKQDLNEFIKRLNFGKIKIEKIFKTKKNNISIKTL